MEKFKSVRTMEELLNTLELSSEKISIINGGTDFLVRYNGRMHQLENHFIIDISQLKELNFINITKENLEIGATVTHSDIAKNQIIKDNFSALSDAASDIGSEQIRNRGTLVGNIVNSSPGGDCIPVLIALDGEVEVLNSKGGKKLVKVQDFVTGPGKNILEDKEIVSKILIPIKKGYRSSFGKYALGNKKHVVIANVSISLNAQLQNDKIIDAKIVLGACSSKPLISKEGELTLIGNSINQSTLENFRNALMNDVHKSVELRPEFHYKIDAIKGLSTDIFEKLFSYKEEINE